MNTVVRLTRDGSEVSHRTVFDALADESSKQVLAEISFRDEPIEGPGVEDCMHAFRRRRVRQEVSRVRREIIELQKGNADPSEVDRRLLRQAQLAREREAL